MSVSTVFHLLLEEDWTRARDAGVYTPTSLQQEGFIHFSTRAQVLGSANRYYRAYEELLVLEVPVAALGDSLVWENTVGGTEPFPHGYAALAVSAVTGVHRVRSGPDGFCWTEQD